MVKRLHKELVSIRYNAKLKEIKGKYRSEKVASVNNKTGAEEMPIDWVVICVVAEPDTELARKMGLEMTKGFVKVDGQMKTSKKGEMFESAKNGRYAGECLAMLRESGG